MKAIVTSFVVPALKGSGQILFQASALTGSAFLVLVLSQSPYAFVMCLAGLIGATLCAFFLERPSAAYSEGAGGFNGALLGLALAAFFAPGACLLAVSFVGGLLTGVVRVALVRLLPLPAFTAPYVLVAWLVEYVCRHGFALASVGMPATSAVPAAALATNASQVLFIATPWIGPLVVLAVLLHSRAAAVWVATASLVAWLTTLVFGMPVGLTAAGLLGYNALILASGLQGRNIPLPLALGGVVISVWLSVLFFQAQLTTLSAPFVLSAWLVISLQQLSIKEARPPR